MLKRLLIGAMMVAVAMLVIQSMPDIKRYLKIRSM